MSVWIVSARSHSRRPPYHSPAPAGGVDRPVLKPLGATALGHRQGLLIALYVHPFQGAATKATVQKGWEESHGGRCLPVLFPSPARLYPPTPTRPSRCFLAFLPSLGGTLQSIDSHLGAGPSQPCQPPTMAGLNKS